MFLSWLVPVAASIMLTNPLGQLPAGDIVALEFETYGAVLKQKRDSMMTIICVYMRCTLSCARHHHRQSSGLECSISTLRKHRLLD